MKRVMTELQKRIVGKEAVIKKLWIALLSGGHVLLEDVPGVGKTLVAKTLAEVMDCTFSRIQFTPDLMPSDIMGYTVLAGDGRSLEFRKGPIHNNIVLADEINRTSPKTQSGLLEAMEEKQVTIDGQTYKLEAPFMVIATQNPIEYEGTFPLPEAQLDRFFMKLSLGYPGFDEELGILGLEGRHQNISAVYTRAEICEMQDEATDVYVDAAVEKYMTHIVRQTRTHGDVTLGCSPRATLALYRCAKASAYVDGRDYVMPEDVEGHAVSVLSHRMILKPEARYRGVEPEEIIDEILDQAIMPKVGDYDAKF